MNKYNRFMVTILLVQCIFIALFSAFFIRYKNSGGSRQYRIEAERASRELMQKEPQDIDMTGYPSLIRISRFNADEACNNDYVVTKARGVLYRIEYRAGDSDRTMIFADAALVLMLIFTFIMLMFIRTKIIRPFNAMSNMTYELAKGNLAVPVKEEKSRFFGKFLWGMDMLRDSLESDKEKELELQKEKKTLILSLSHDIKTPLSAIELYSKALSTGLYETSEDKTRALDGIDRNVSDIKEYVNKIVTASREDFLNLEVHDGEFYLSALLDRISTYYKEKLELLHTEFTVGKASDCLLKGDIDRVVEVLQNIMENAVKYGDGRHIEITVSEEEDCRIITVTDTGCGLDASELPKLFDSFYRGSNSTGIRGSGLGLYICRNLMRKMDGDVYAAVRDGNFSASAVIRKAV